MLLGLVLATAGTIEVLDQPMPAGRRQVLPRVGALIEGPAAYGHLSARTNLALLDASGPGGARNTRARRIGEVLEQVGLADVGSRPVKAFSLGMRQRLGLGAALLRRPDLLVLDEPTNGLDPQGIHEIRELLLGLHASGTTVFLSSHLLAEVEQLCTRIGVLDRGRLVLQDHIEALRPSTGRTLVTLASPEDLHRARELLRERAQPDGELRLIADEPDAAALNRRLVEAGIGVRGLDQQRMSLEQTVLAATA